jgi:hypothetical protein
MSGICASLRQAAGNVLSVPAVLFSTIRIGAIFSALLNLAAPMARSPLGFDRQREMHPLSRLKTINLTWVFANFANIIQG